MDHLCIRFTFTRNHEKKTELPLFLMIEFHRFFMECLLVKLEPQAYILQTYHTTQF